MNRPGNLRDFITTRITSKIIDLLHETDLNSSLGLRFDLSFCSKFARAGCNCGDFYQTVAERIKHWEQHPQLRLGLADCAWILGGGLLRWQKFKSQYAPQMPPPLIDENNKKSWSLDELKVLVASLDLTEPNTKEAKAWAEFRQQIDKNQIRWYKTIPRLLNLSSAEVLIEKLKEMPYSQKMEKITNWVKPIVDHRVPEHLNANYEDTWQFVKSQENRKWLEEFSITRPCDLFGWIEFDGDEAWDVLNPAFDDSQPTFGVQGSLPTNLALKATQVMQVLSTLAHSSVQNWMLVAERIEKQELFNFVELYKTVYCLDVHSVIKIIAPPDCSAQELNELILENCFRRYQYNDIPRTLPRARRLTWEVIKMQQDFCDIQTCLIVIACAQNLSKSAVKEIEDLNLRCEVSFLMGSNANDTDFPLIDIADKIGLITLPPPEVVREIIASINSLMLQGLAAEDAFEQIQSQTLSIAKRFDYNQK